MGKYAQENSNNESGRKLRRRQSGIKVQLRNEPDNLHPLKKTEGRYPFFSLRSDPRTKSTPIEGHQIYRLYIETGNVIASNQRQRENYFSSSQQKTYLEVMKKRLAEALLFFLPLGAPDLLCKRGNYPYTRKEKKKGIKRSEKE